ncbi:MAG: bifunctional phosphoglucose/phosphomannose isomerase [Candidatus Spechtbacteria bacterium SB0662_bin_43]|uniref:Bifunctional phosphoglucose/phosphomannose isomerase n=1 Tax=Candidatus Spechtbacteria bacterium SB0662_bin_43 TaxID=2604897 RepID=A0A845D9T0_9BACT|nr:bifunctional phosphoglucose/phosphomannose isomerase [Candidatus Spechtbacteria bacterium SB0662_bin_43]
MQGNQIETEFNKHFTHGYLTTETLGDMYNKSTFERILVIGIGGSALSGTLLSTLMKEIDDSIDVFIHRTYDLPARSIYSKALVILISYSGNTEEVLDAYQEASRKNLPIIAMTSGGQLEQYAHKDKTPLFLLPKGMKPRFSLMYQIGALIAILENTNIIQSQKHIVEKLQQNDYNKISHEAQKAIDHIGANTPLIYASSKYASLAYIIKIQMNENAKIHAFSNIFPETNHNEIMGHTTDPKSAHYGGILLRSQDDDPRIQHQQDIFIEILEEHGNTIHSIDITGATCYNTIFQGVLLGHLMSFHLAKQRNINPYQTTAIEECKKRINKKTAPTTKLKQSIHS